MVQEFHEGKNIRLSVNRTMPGKDSWLEDITWEELQTVKREVGYGDRLAVEIYPEDVNIVNVANMRHLWIIDGLDLGWKR